MTKKEIRKKKKLKKKRNRLYMKVYKNKDDMNEYLYYPLQIITLLIEVIRKFLVIVSWFLLPLILLIIIISIFLFTKYYPSFEQYQKDAIEIVSNSSIDDFRTVESSIIYDNNGNVLATLYENADMKYLTYDEIPKDVINAFIAVEDRSFWDNKGIDLKGLTRVGYRFLVTEGEEVTGASTITQQLARNVFLTHERSIERKIKEILISLELTKKYSKEEIIEFYCNNICFSNGIYGISGASKAYFNKDISECNLKEIAYLCAIPNRPEYFNPYKYPDRPLERSKKILKDMMECGYISQFDYYLNRDKEVNIEKPKYEFNNFQTTFAVNCAVKELMKNDNFEFRYKFENMKDYKEYKKLYEENYNLYKHKLYTGGYKIYTSLNIEAYNKVQEVLDEILSFNEDLDENTGVYQFQGAMTIIDNKTDKVIAVVGGRSQDTNYVYSLNRAFQSPRQPGSTIKPIAVYAPSFENGFKANSLVPNISVSAAQQKDVDIKSLGGELLVLRSAVEKSINGVAWKVFDTITPEVGLSYLENMNFSYLCPNDYINSASLGGLTYGATTVEMAGAYNCLNNHGLWYEPTCILKLIDNNDEDIYSELTNKVYSSKTADDMVDVLKGVLIRGTGASLGWGNKSIEAFGKTGTTDESKDGWFCGATPYYTIAVWVGYDVPKPMDNLYGSTYPGKIWAESMNILTEGLDKAQFIKDFEDESYTNVIHSNSWYQYLPDRDETEELAPNYTVADYRDDRIIGEEVQTIINKINSLDSSSVDFVNIINSLYNKGNLTIETIYSSNYKSEMKNALDVTYQNKLNN